MWWLGLLSARAVVVGQAVAGASSASRAVTRWSNLVADWADLLGGLAGRVVQSQYRYRLPGYTGQASPQPIVITTSAAWTLSLVSGLGNSWDRSRPISSMTATTAGLIESAGVEPAERTVTLPPAWWCSRAAVSG